MIKSDVPVSPPTHLETISVGNKTELELVLTPKCLKLRFTLRRYSEKTLPNSVLYLTISS